MKPLFSLLILVLCAAGSTSEKPNFVFLFSDDQQADTIGGLGNARIETPNLDRMVGEGFSFRSAYCGGSFSGAVCVASRSMLMTGHHWHQIEDKKNWKGFTTLPEKLTKAGYHSHIVGKWHNGEKTLLRSFQSGSSVFIGGMTNHLEVPLAEIVDGKLENKRVAKGFSTTMFTEATVEFLKKEQKDPFFLYVAYTAPHDTRNPPQKYRDMYYKKKLPLPANFMPLHPFDNGRIDQRFRDESLAPWPRPEGMIRDQIAEYYGLVTQLDEPTPYLPSPIPSTAPPSAPPQKQIPSSDPDNWVTIKTYTPVDGVHTWDFVPETDSAFFRLNVPMQMEP